MSIQWRPLLVQMQGILRSQTATGTNQIPLSMSAEGYGLLGQLEASGVAYDATGNDGVANPNAFSVLLGLYITQALGTFVELDRLSRWIFGLYSGSDPFNPQYAIDFGVITQAQGADWFQFLVLQFAGAPIPSSLSIPSFDAPAPLAFDYTGGNFATLNLRANDMLTLVEAAQGYLLPGSVAQTTVMRTAFNAWTSGIWWDNASPQASHAFTSPPTNPSASVDSGSVAAVKYLNTSIANAQAWLSAIAFT